jgi:hypothetical protein
MISPTLLLHFTNWLEWQNRAKLVVANVLLIESQLVAFSRPSGQAFSIKYLAYFEIRLDANLSNSLLRLATSWPFPGT